ncbi:MAG: AMP-binding protein [Bacteroidales bacterium]|nr:AMP-binding protein [Bacteroidales bacterium]
MSHRILSELLITTAKEFPAKGIGFIQPDKTILLLTYPMLLEQSLRVLQGLQHRGLTSGDRVILSLETSEETITTIWALFLGGMIPALLQSPLTFSEYNPAVEKTERVFQILDHPFMIISHKHSIHWMQRRIPESALIDFSELSSDAGSPAFPDIQPDDLALIQFSSGSTGDPKGVMLTHRNMLANIRDIIEGIQLTHEDVSVSWMPLYHDMGLIGFHITPTLVGCQQYFVDPVDFVKNPSLWLDNLSSKRCNITGCPNFGQALVNRYIGRRTNPDWDFSGVRVIFNGAEPISTGTMSDFLTALSGFGLNPAAMFPAYGLAEATLAVTFAPLDEEAEVVRFQRTPLIKEGVARLAESGDADAMELVNLGQPLTHCTLRIIGEEGVEALEGNIGSVQVQGENVSSGYFRNPEATGQTFGDNWLHTGDLGFMHEGNLFIVGRLKDVIFINGINFYAHDLEVIASSIEGIIPGKLVIAAYFNEKEGRDKLLVFLVGSDNEEAREIFLKIRNHLKNTLGLHPDTFLPIRSNDIPRTSSGKIQRYKMVNRFLQGEFNVVRV